MLSVMERSEPALVPEWLKNSASSTGGSTLSHADDLSAPRISKNKSITNSNGHSHLRASGFEKTSSAYFRRGSSENSSGKFRSYSGSGRNQRDREWEKDAYGSRDQGKLFLEDSRHREFLEPEGQPLFSRFERDGLRRTQSMLPGKHGDTQPRKVVTDLSAGGKNAEMSLLSKVSLPHGANKTNFERDFPSLGTDERVVLPDVGRVPSPGLTTAIQRLPVSASTSVGEKWTSALAEVPMLVGSNGSASSSASQVASSASPSVSLGANAGFNMAEALTHGPVCAQTAPQLSVEAQRREELAIRQSRQLIPMTPSMPKSLASNMLDKPKTKVGQVPSPVISSATANHSPRGVPGNGDASKSSNPGNFHVLKSAREKNGVSFGMKDNLSPTSNNKAGSSVFAAPPVAASRNQINNGDRKPGLAVVDKRPISQAQSRNEFFNLVRKKSMANSSPACDSDLLNSSFVTENSGNAKSPLFSDNHSEMNVLLTSDKDTADAQLSGISQNVDTSPTVKALLTCNGDACNDQKPHLNGTAHHPCSEPIIKEEEEAAFLRSLGWEENDEEGGLTEEEISSFRMNLSKYIESNPSPRILQEKQLAFLLPFDSQKGKGISYPSDANPES